MLTLMLSTLVINIVLFIYIPKGFFPEQDIGRLTGIIQASQDISFQAMKQKLSEVVDIIRTDPEVTDVVGFTGGWRRRRFHREYGTHVYNAQAL